MDSGREQRPGHTPREAGASRRDFLKKSAIAGGVLWAAPAVTRMSKAHAQGVGSPPIGQCGNDCVTTAYGAFIDLLGPMRFPAAPGSPCPVGTCEPVDVGGLPVPFELNAGAACGCTGTVPNDACLAEGSVAEVLLRVDKTTFGAFGTQDLVVRASVLKSTTSQDCVDCGTAARSSHIAALTINLPDGTNVPITAETLPNTVVVDSTTTFPGLRIVVNEQGCTAEGNWYTAALTIKLPTGTPLPGRTIILGYSEARSRGCASDQCTTPSDTAEIVPIP